MQELDAPLLRFGTPRNDNVSISKQREPIIISDDSDEEDEHKPTTPPKMKLKKEFNERIKNNEKSEYTRKKKPDFFEGKLKKACKTESQTSTPLQSASTHETNDKQPWIISKKGYIKKDQDTKEQKNDIDESSEEEYQFSQNTNSQSSEASTHSPIVYKKNKKSKREYLNDSLGSLEDFIVDNDEIEYETDSLQQNEEEEDADDPIEAFSSDASVEENTQQNDDFESSDDIDDYVVQPKKKDKKKKKKRKRSDAELRALEKLFGYDDNSTIDSFFKPLKKKKINQDALNVRKESSKYNEEMEKRKEEQIKKLKMQEEEEEKDFPIEKRIINLGHKPNEKSILLPCKLARLLKPHQLEGIQFLWEKIVMPESDNLRGCILAHCNILLLYVLMMC